MKKKGISEMEEHTTYLVHYGVKGMRWGVRRYQNYDGTIKNPSHFRSIRQMQYTGKMWDEKIKKAKNSKDFVTKASHIVGNRGAATAAKINSEYYKGEASIARTNFGRKLNTARSKNWAEMTKLYNKRAKRTIGERFVASYFDSDAWNTPYHRMSGRTTTRGEEAVNRMLFGIPGAIGDIKYDKNKKAQSKS